MNALSIPTWAVHFSSVFEFVFAMNLIWQYAAVTGNEKWKVPFVRPLQSTAADASTLRPPQPSAPSLPHHPSNSHALPAGLAPELPVDFFHFFFYNKALRGCLLARCRG